MARTRMTLAQQVRFARLRADAINKAVNTAEQAPRDGDEQVAFDSLITAMDNADQLSATLEKVETIK